MTLESQGDSPFDARGLHLIEALLEDAVGDPQRRRRREERRAAALLRAIAEERDSPKPRPAPKPARRGAWRRWAPWLSIPAAAAVLAAALILGPPSRTSLAAQAAVQRALQTERKPSARDREYAISLTTRTLGGRSLRREWTLFLKSRQRFALRHQGWLGGELWVGGYDAQRWLVPPLGPVLVGDDGLLQKSVRRKQMFDTPFLHVSAILQRLAQVYDLELLEDEAVEGLPEDSAPQVVCQRVVARLRQSASAGLPQQVTLWTDATGRTRRLIAQWRRSAGAPGWLAYEIRLTGMPQLDDAFFRHESHHGGQRRVVQDEPR